VSGQLSAPVDVGETAISLMNVAPFPVSGIVQIDDELLSFVGTTTGNAGAGVGAGIEHGDRAGILTNVRRGLRGTDAANHLVGAPVTLVAPLCTGDCSGEGRVGVDELVDGVGIALDRMPLERCVVFDEDADGNVAVDELIRAVAFALTDCP
jgi:hypothetical protein